MTEATTTTITDTPVSPTAPTATPLGGAFAVDAGKVQSHLDRVVRGTRPANHVGVRDGVRP